MDQEKMGKFFGILAACVGMAILIFSRNQEVRVLQYYINYFTLLVFGLLCVAGVLLSGKKTKMEILSVLYGVSSYLVVTILKLLGEKEEK